MDRVRGWRSLYTSSGRPRKRELSALPSHQHATPGASVRGGEQQKEILALDRTDAEVEAMPIRSRAHWARSSCSVRCTLERGVARTSEWLGRHHPGPFRSLSADRPGGGATVLERRKA